MKKILVRLPALLSACLLTLSSHAQETKPDQSPLRINGFGTLGLTSTFAPDGWYFRRDASQYPSHHQTTLETDSRIGLQAHYEVSPSLELVSQLVLKRRLPGADPSESLEWLFASYKPRGDLTIRLGRTSPDVFLISDYRNVGVAYPWVRPNVELYAALPLYTIDGADASYVWDAGDARWRVKAFTGMGQARATLASANDQVIFKLNHAAGAMVSREKDGLLLRATLAGARLTSESVNDMSASVGALRSLRDYPNPTVAQEASNLYLNYGVETDTALFAELGLNYDLDEWICSAEYALVSISSGTRAAQSAYLSIGRRFGDFTLYGMLGRTVSKHSEQVAPDWSALGSTLNNLGAGVAYGINASRARQSSLSLGTRWDFHPQMALKLQVDHFWVSNVGRGLWVGPGLQKAEPNVLSATLDFTF